jgi:outer membrane protein W
MKIGIGIELPAKADNPNYCVNFTNASLNSFEQKIFKYDYTKFGVTINSVNSINICGIIGIMFNIEDHNILNITELKKFLQTKANQTIKIKNYESKPE